MTRKGVISIKNFLSKAMLALGGVGAFISAKAAHAATDPDATAAIASSTAVLTDNKGLVLGFMATIFGIVIVFVIVKRLLGSGKAQIAGAIGGIRRGRR